MTKTLSIGISLILLIALTPVAFGQVNIFDSNSLINEALRLNNLGEYEEALDLLNKALEIDPNNVHALNNKGWALLELEKYEEAMVWFDKALEVDPNYIHALNNKGFALYRLGQYDEAISYYDKALEIDPNYEFAKENKELALEGEQGGIGDYTEIIALAVVGVIISVIVLRIKKRNTQKLFKTKRTIS